MLELTLLHYGYALIFAGTIIEGDGTLLTAAFLAHRGRFAFSMVLLTAGIATLVANEVYFFLGRRHGRAWLTRLSAENPRVRTVEGWMRQGAATKLVLSRFFYGLRTAIPAACGAVGMAPARFSFFNLLGAVLWTGTVGFAGYFGSRGIAALIDDMQRHEWTIAALILLTGTIATLWRSRGRDPFFVWVSLRSPSAAGSKSVRGVRTRFFGMLPGEAAKEAGTLEE